MVLLLPGSQKVTANSLGKNTITKERALQTIHRHGPPDPKQHSTCRALHCELEVRHLPCMATVPPYQQQYGESLHPPKRGNFIALGDVQLPCSWPAGLLPALLAMGSQGEGIGDGDRRNAPCFPSVVMGVHCSDHRHRGAENVGSPHGTREC